MCIESAMTKVLNAYAGIGGNRKLWKNVDVTAIEHNSNIAAIYKDYFPNDTVIVTDAHQYILENYKDFDFIWSSPPCPSHSNIRRMAVIQGQYSAIYPDLRLWQEITLLKHFYKGKWVIENVFPYYKPIETPSFIIDRHCFWTNFIVYRTEFTKREKTHQKINGNEIIFGFDLSNYNIKNKRQILRNMVNPEIGLHILNSALKRIDTAKKEQMTLFF